MSIVLFQGNLRGFDWQVKQSPAVHTHQYDLVTIRRRGKLVDHMTVHHDELLALGHRHWVEELVKRNEQALFQMVEGHYEDMVD
jgi:hypothetical protein